MGAFNGVTQDILIEKNYIYDNDIIGSNYEHNTYTAAIGITYQYNHMGRLREGAGGNNLKNRSAGLTVRYNWIEDGNRQLGLVDAEDSTHLVNHPSYDTAHVYGNVLLEGDGELNYYTQKDQRSALDPITGPNGVSFENRAAQYRVSYMNGNDQPDYVAMARIKEAGMATGYRFRITRLESSTQTTRGKHWERWSRPNKLRCVPHC